MSLLTPIALLSTIFCGLIAMLYLYGRLMRYIHNRSSPVNKNRLLDWLSEHGVALATADDVIEHCNVLARDLEPREGGVQWKQFKVDKLIAGTSLPEFEITSIKSMNQDHVTFTCSVQWPECVPGMEVGVLLGDDRVTCHAQVDWMIMSAKCTIKRIPENGGVTISWTQTTPPVSALSCMVIDPPKWKTVIDVSKPLLEDPDTEESEGVASSVAEGIVTLIKSFELSDYRVQPKDTPTTLEKDTPTFTSDINHNNVISSDTPNQLIKPDNVAMPTQLIKPDNGNNNGVDSRTPDVSDEESDSSGLCVEVGDIPVLTPDNEEKPQISKASVGVAGHTHSLESKDTNSVLTDLTPNGNYDNEHSSAHNSLNSDNDKTDHDHTHSDDRHDDRNANAHTNNTPNDNDLLTDYVIVSPSSPTTDTEVLGLTPPIINHTSLNANDKWQNHLPVITEPLEEKTPPPDTSTTSNDPTHTESPINDELSPTENSGTNWSTSSWRRSFHDGIPDDSSPAPSPRPLPSYLRVLTYSDDDLLSSDKSPFDRSKTLSIRSYDTDSPATDASGRFLSTVVFEVDNTVGGIHGITGGDQYSHIVALNPSHARRLRKQLSKYTKLHIYNDHTFVATHIKGKQVCVVCNEKIGGLFGKQAYVCRDCGLSTHKNCHHKTETNCSKSKVSSLNLIYPEKISAYSSRN